MGELLQQVGAIRRMAKRRHPIELGELVRFARLGRMAEELQHGAQATRVLRRRVDRRIDAGIATGVRGGGMEGR